MKPSKLYAREPEEISYELYGLIEHHIQEIDSYDFDYDDNKKTKHIEIRYYKNFDFDGRRSWTLAGVFFNDVNNAAAKQEPIMIIQNAGREGDDHTDRFITNRDGYLRMIKYLLSCANAPEPDVISPDEDIRGLESFYGNTLDGHFERYRY